MPASDRDHHRRSRRQPDGVVWRDRRIVLAILALLIPERRRRHPGARRSGVTRGKGLVVLLGQKKAGAIAVHNLSGRRRMIARRRLGPDMESVALYWAIKPHT